MSTINERIVEAMKMRRIGTVELAKALDITPASVSQWISGRSAPRYERVHQIANVLNVSEAWIYGADGPMDQDRLTQDEIVRVLRNPDIMDIVIKCSKMRPEDVEVVRRLAEVIIEQGRDV